MTESPKESAPIERTAGITFTNQPRVSSDPKVAENHEERMALAGKIEAFLAKHSLFKDKKINVTFAQDGVASLIAILEMPDEETSNERMVLKIPFGGRPTSGEAFAFRAWEAEGVSVPRVVEQGIFDEKHEYLLMSCIDAPALDKAYSSNEEMVANGIYAELGEAFAGMHASTVEGFGAIGTDGKGEFATFEEWIDSPKMTKDIPYVTDKENNLMDADLIVRARMVLIEYAKAHPRSTVCHLDFATNNAFATKPVTIFDPAPEFNLPYIDTGKTFVNMTANGEPARAQLFDAYEKKTSAPLDKKVAYAATVIMMIRKLAKSHKTGGPKMEERIARNKAYLADNAHFLDS